MTKDAKVRDPVCGMSIYEFKAVAMTDYQGTTYRFCSQMCRQQFLTHPERYATSEPQARAARAGGCPE